jgi:hypothetical protein
MHLTVLTLLLLLLCIKILTTPSVRRLAKEHQVDLAQVGQRRQCLCLPFTVLSVVFPDCRYRQEWTHHEGGSFLLGCRYLLVVTTLFLSGGFVELD